MTQRGLGDGQEEKSLLYCIAFPQPNSCLSGRARGTEGGQWGQVLGRAPSSGLVSVCPLSPSHKEGKKGESECLSVEPATIPEVMEPEFILCPFPKQSFLDTLKATSQHPLPIGHDSPL